MKIILVGASGTIGKAVAETLGARHDVITASRSGADITLDITDATSILAAYDKVGRFDAVVSTTGTVKFAPLADMTEADYRIGIDHKLMGQVNLVLLGRERMSDGGSFTLTTGVLDHDPIVAGSSASMVNGAINSFAVAAAIEMTRGQRINVVSPGLIEESVPDYGPFFPGHHPVSAARAALGYVKSVEGAQTGQVFSIL